MLHGVINMVFFYLRGMVNLIKGHSSSSKNNGIGPLHVFDIGQINLSYSNVLVSAITNQCMGNTSIVRLVSCLSCTGDGVNRNKGQSWIGDYLFWYSNRGDLEKVLEQDYDREFDRSKDVEHVLLSEYMQCQP